MKEIVTNKFNRVIDFLSNLADHDGRSGGDGGNRPPRHRLQRRAASAGLCAGWPERDEPCDPGGRRLCRDHHLLRIVALLTLADTVLARIARGLRPR